MLAIASRFILFMAYMLQPSVLQKIFMILMLRRWTRLATSLLWHLPEERLSKESPGLISARA